MKLNIVDLEYKCYRFLHDNVKIGSTYRQMANIGCFAIIRELARPAFKRGLSEVLNENKELLSRLAK